MDINLVKELIGLVLVALEKFHLRGEDDGLRAQIRQSLGRVLQELQVEKKE